jgi:hypothetical protein
MIFYIFGISVPDLKSIEFSCLRKIPDSQII